MRLQAEITERGRAVAAVGYRRICTVTLLTRSRLLGFSELQGFEFVGDSEIGQKSHRAIIWDPVLGSTLRTDKLRFFLGLLYDTL